MNNNLEDLRSIFFPEAGFNPIRENPPEDLSSYKNIEDAEESVILIPPDAPPFDPSDPDSVYEMSIWLENRYKFPPPFIADPQLDDSSIFIVKRLSDSQYSRFMQVRKDAEALYAKWKAEGRAGRPRYTMGDAIEITDFKE